MNGQITTVSLPDKPRPTEVTIDFQRGLIAP
jgi:hypothetical protein